jgi:hypothetical protein
MSAIGFRPDTKIVVLLAIFRKSRYISMLALRGGYTYSSNQVWTKCHKALAPLPVELAVLLGFWLENVPTRNVSFRLGMPLEKSAGMMVPSEVRSTVPFVKVSYEKLT